MKRWILSPPDPNKAGEISRSLNLSPLISQILVNRQITTPEALTQFLQPSLAHLPDPKEMKDMEKATNRLVNAIRHQEPITIYGDYDVDGTTATALLMEFFHQVGAKADFYIPHRIHEGYSLNEGALRHIAARGTKVLITVDNGISAVKEAQIAKELNMDLIITDHHEVPAELPDAFAILNPKQVDDAFPGKELAGVGVAYYLLMGLRRTLREAGLLPDKEPNLRMALDLVAVGTVADLAPLKGLNRILVREGLKVISQRARLGFRALLDISGVDGEVRADQLAFRIGPRINAVGRLEEADLGVKLLLTKEPVQATNLAQILDQANISRKELEDEISEAAVARLERDGVIENFRSIVLFQEDWHQGVIGIVASRMVDRYYLPTIIMTRDQAGLKGSARSIRSFHLVEALRECADLLGKFGGHAYAAGLSMPEKNLEAFRQRFDQVVRRRLEKDDFIPYLQMDVESSLNQIDATFMEQLSRLEPFGLGNPAPLFLLKGATVKESRVVGEKHLKMRIGHGPRSLGAIGFRLGGRQPAGGSQVDLAFTPEWNEWNGSKNIQLRLLDLRDP